MGLMGDWWRGKRMKDPVRGTAHIAGCSRYTDAATSSNIVMTLVVSAEGLAATTVEHECFCRHDRWPSPGATLPVTVDRADPTRLKVEWDEVRTHEDRIAEQAQMMASHLNAGGGGARGGDLVDQLRTVFPGAQVTVGEPQVIDLSGGADQVEQLERLAALQRSGGLTDEEFSAAKARLLG